MANFNGHKNIGNRKTLRLSDCSPLAIDMGSPVAYGTYGSEIRNTEFSKGSTEGSNGANRN